MDHSKSFLYELACLLRNNGERILSGNSKLSLTSVLLQKLNESFDLIADPEAALGSFNVLASRHYPEAILYDVQFLYDFVQKTVAVHICNDSSVGHRVDLSRFSNLRFLELNKVPAESIVGLKAARNKLKKISCNRGLRELQELLLRCGGDRSDGFTWPELQEADFSYNTLLDLDLSLKLTPWLEVLDLSHNQLSATNGLELLPKIGVLNLNFNLLQNVPSFSSEAAPKLRVLLIRNNKLESLEGIQTLVSLQVLDVAHNCISSHMLLRPLQRLPLLTTLCLEGNPISYSANHRVRAAAFLCHCTLSTQFQMNGVRLTKSEVAQATSHAASISPGSLKQADETPSSTDNIPALSLIHSGESDCLETSMSSCTSESRRSGKKTVRKREAEIAEPSTAYSPLKEVHVYSSSAEHLRTKEELETLIETFGKDNWLHQAAAIRVQDILGLSGSHQTHSETEPVRWFLESESSSKIAEVQTKKEGHSIAEEHQGKKVQDTSMTAEQLLDKKGKDTDVSAEPIQDKTGKDADVPMESTNDESFYTANDMSHMDSTYTSAAQTEEEMHTIEGAADDGEHLFFVKCQSSSGELSDVILAANEYCLREKDSYTINTKIQWYFDDIVYLEKIETSPPTIQLVFSSGQKDRRKRVYILSEDSDYDVLRDAIRSHSDRKALQECVDGALQCLNCSSQFSREVANTKICTTKNKERNTGRKEQDTVVEIPICPNCDSEMIVETDEVPFPSVFSDNNSSTPCNSMTMSVSPQNGSSLTASTGGLPIVVSNISSSPMSAVGPSQDASHRGSCGNIHINKGSAASLLEETRSKPSDSDIEVLSNPSQSSIEVLTGGRTVDSDSDNDTYIAPKHTCALSPDRASRHREHSGIDSSSSGSPTESVCTAYESQTGQLGGSISSPSLQDVQEIEHPVGEEEKETSLLLPPCPSDFVKGHSGDRVTISHVHVVTADVNDWVEKHQVATKVDKDEVGSAQKGGIRYSFSSFDHPDHRIKLYCDVTLFEKNEELLSLVKVNILSPAKPAHFCGLLVISTCRTYILKITGEETDEPQRWLRAIETFNNTNFVRVLIMVGRMGFAIEYDKQHKCPHLFFLMDETRTTQFMVHFAGIMQRINPNGSIEIVGKNESQKRDLLHVLSKHDLNPDKVILSVVPCTVQISSNTNACQLHLIAVSPSEIVLLAEDMRWLFPDATSNVEIYKTEKMNNLFGLAVCSQFPSTLTLSFHDEDSGVEEEWVVTFETEASLVNLLGKIVDPWESIFSVGLQVTTCCNSDDSTTQVTSRINFRTKGRNMK